MQLVTGRPASDIDKAAAVIEEACDLLPGSVVCDSGSGAQLWVYQWALRRPAPPAPADECLLLARTTGLS
ncbi:hypothetical protein ACFWN5_19140 [Streptomyces sp. NPDC058430]|uniref:hypothetical protein n=1 Tax=Streptomyces sp. NPDC058430 TaxID=3346495 RepID=UPI00366579AF